MYMLLRYINQTNLAINPSLFLFDRMIVPILCFASEVWGFTITKSVGRYPLHTIYMLNLIKCYYIIHMPSERLPKAYKLDGAGRNTWATNVKVVM